MDESGSPVTNELRSCHLTTRDRIGPHIPYITIDRPDAQWPPLPIRILVQFLVGLERDRSRRTRMLTNSKTPQWRTVSYCRPIGNAEEMADEDLQSCRGSVMLPARWVM